MSELCDSDSAMVRKLIDGAARAIAEAQFCWLATVDASGLPRLRPMGRLPPKRDDDAWTLRFITDGRSGKAANIRRDSKVGLVFQREAEEAFVALTGVARLEEREAEVRRLWKPAYDPFFPSEADKASAVFLAVAAERLDLWIRGVTPEPFGLKTTTLERDAGGDWRLAAEDRPGA